MHPLIPRAASVAALTLLAQAPIAAQPAGPRFADVHLSTGVRLHYAEQGAAGAEAIIMLHGYSDSWFSFSQAMPLLAAHYHVYALDQRGHGDSDRPADGYHMRDLAADVLAFMDAKQIVRATIVGHSMGSYAAQQVALAAPRRVSQLVLIGSSTAPRTITGFDELATAVTALEDPVPTRFLREFQVSTVYQNVSDAFIERAVEESAKLPARVWKGVLAGMTATEPATALGRSGVPTLILWGEKDAYMSRSEQAALLATIRSARLKTYPNTGHALHWEHPEAFARDVHAFIAGRATASETATRSR